MKADPPPSCTEVGSVSGYKVGPNYQDRLKNDLRNDAAVMVEGWPHERRPDDTVQIGAEDWRGLRGGLPVWGLPFQAQLATSPRSQPPRSYSVS